MGQLFSALNENHIDFINEQKIFFVATAATEGSVNLSPKGLDTLKVQGPSSLVWLNYTGSGNETAAHILRNPRMTIMLCSFSEKPLILRIYGQAAAVHDRDPQWPELIRLFPGKEGARQIFKVDIERVQTSCGFAVPLYDFKNERDTLDQWTNKKGPEKIREYQIEKNATSLDGFPTGIA